MKLIAETKDPYYIKALNHHENIYYQWSFDGSVSLDKWVPPLDAIWIVLYQDSDPAGLIRLDRIGNKMAQPHIFIYKKYRGKESALWGHMVMKYVKHYYGITSYIALTPKKSAKQYTEHLGFKLQTIIPKSILLNGKLEDQYLLTYSED